MNRFIGIYYFNQFIITADDMLMNLINYHFANNYSNIDLPGYMYNLRKVSMSRGDGGIELKTIRSMNYLLYFRIFYKYIKEFKMSRKALYLEMKNLKRFIYFIKDYNITLIEKKTIDFLNEIVSDKYAYIPFKFFINNLLIYFEEKQKINF